jgi:predicted lipid-binding transport protein (Tim44 family)
MGAVGWWREVLPRERVEHVARRPAAERARAIVPSLAAVEHLRAGEAGRRVRVPVAVQPNSSGMQGGLVGGAAMAVVALLLWTGLIWAVLGMVNPALNARIDWVWFIASQIAFGLMVGLVVARAQPIATMQT